VVLAFARAGYGKPGLNMLDIRFNDFYWTGDSLKWTLWDWHKTRNESNRLAINMALLDKEKQSLEKSLQIQLIDKKGTVAEIRKQMEADNQLLELHNEIVAYYASQLDNGASPLPILLNSLTSKNRHASTNSFI
jgi:hypothetical protein